MKRTLAGCLLVATLGFTVPHLLFASEPPPTAVEGLRSLGRVQPRAATAIGGSLIGVGAETMDRDFTTFAHWRDYLGPLGAKKARLQAGWARSEPVPGQYDWAWQDAIVDGVVAAGVEPWMTLCYGNPAYPDGGTAQSNSPLPEGAAREAWLAFVRQVVRRYGDRIDEWEVWNEPIHMRISVEAYTGFYLRTAEAIRAEQPRARLLALATAGIDPGQAREFLERMAAAGRLDAVDAITYHPYTTNPDAAYGRVEHLRRTVAALAPHVVIRQGECGAPSEKGTYGALAEYDWTETSQAKWALRRHLADVARGIETSCFGIVDMWYTSGVNRKGLLAAAPDRTVERPKQAYRAMQHLCALADQTLTPDPALAVTVAATGSLARPAFRREGRPVVALWEDGAAPGDATATRRCDLTLGAVLTDPVWVDLRTGAVAAFPRAAWSVAEGATTIRGVPVYDSPVLITDRHALGPAFAEQP